MISVCYKLSIRSGITAGKFPIPLSDSGLKRPKLSVHHGAALNYRTGMWGEEERLSPCTQSRGKGWKLHHPELSYCHIALCETRLGTSPTCSSSFPVQDRPSDQHQLLCKLLLLSEKTWTEPYPSSLIIFVPPCHHQSGWHSHMTTLIFPTVLREAWQGQGCLLRTIKAYLLMYLMSEALCTESKSQG